MFWFITAGTSTARARGETNSNAEFCSKVLTANEVTSMAFSDSDRIGRNAMRSVSTLASAAANTAATAIANMAHACPWRMNQV